ncbi:NADH-quinone oxidoreductase subunit L [Neomegalonema sp.]|uniref:NADH-quinone oxidoreductase subunit L n=1 Tax=Neomegalonema sp. TaxID=2039713 RepID=UPI00262A0B22|nr:NADH-quinone oxidoreductase subunit L [Neomegalonema sp.]MDD2869895.1 NADH-quinone oxidoreductase subunit L [Neomegalonema sp.]
MLTAIVFLPLIGSLISGFFGKRLGETLAQWIPTGLLFASALLSWIVFAQTLGGEDRLVRLFTWISSGELQADWALRADPLTAVMLVVVTTVSALVHLYSVGYMAEDPSKARFFSYLSFFTFAMLMLVTADNFLQMFFGWEGVGVASYLLIGFWHQKDSANAASMKAFIVNRVGDFGFLLGMFGVFAVFRSLDFDTVFAAAPQYAESTFHFLWMEVKVLEAICFLLFIGAMGKSAQFFLHTWLPDAMEGPTPVSALIHAATMVTAGVVMICRLSPLFEWAPGALAFVTFIGATTALFAATVGLVQNDIKRIIAYSTCSQLGYMFFAAGLGAYPVAMFHLFTHAFFKALLFLGAGAVIHAMHHEQDIRKMGGLWRYIPLTFVMMVVGTLAITGLPLLSGFYSKDAIIEVAFVGKGWVAQYAFFVSLLVAAMTSFYSWRLIFKVFFGPRVWKHDPDPHAAHVEEAHDDHGAHAHDDHGHGHHELHPHESPKTMLIPIGVLTVGAILAGAVFAPGFIGSGYEEFWRGSIFFGPDNHIMHDFHDVPLWVKFAPFVMMLTGFFIAWTLYERRRDLPAKIASSQEALYTFFLNRWWFDQAYDFLFVKPAQALGRFLWKKGDGATIDGAIDGASMKIAPAIAGLLRRAQSGYVFHYAFAMILGVVVLVGLAVV